MASTDYGGDENRLRLVPAATGNTAVSTETRDPMATIRALVERTRQLRVASKVHEHNSRHLEEAAESFTATQRALGLVQNEVSEAFGALQEATRPGRESGEDPDESYERALTVVQLLENAASEMALAISWHREAWRLYAESKRATEELSGNGPR
jgi:hypothetical protein